MRIWNGWMSNTKSSDKKWVHSSEVKDTSIKGFGSVRKIDMSTVNGDRIVVYRARRLGLNKHGMRWS